jgi:membrane-associated phospholipid phosphatase
MLFLPLIAFARVYYQCHWIGDTVIGALLGFLMSVIGYSCFHIAGPMFQSIMEI